MPQCLNQLNIFFILLVWILNFRIHFTVEVEFPNIQQSTTDATDDISDKMVNANKMYFHPNFVLLNDHLPF